MNVTITLTDAEQFFYDHAGWSYDPAAETPDHGRARCAIELADAERLLNRDNDAEVTWEEDDTPWDGCEPYDGPMFGAVLRKGSEVMGSLWSIAMESTDEPYARIVAAELAQEYL